MTTEGRVTLTQACVLHRKPYRDTSLLLEVFSRDYGRIGMVARGARNRRGGMQALLQPFQPLLLSWSGRGELRTLTSAEAGALPYRLAATALISGFYLNELLMRLLPRDDPHHEIFDCYSETLMQLQEGADNEWYLRLFERDLLQGLGYGLQLSHDSVTSRPLVDESIYCYHIEHGPAVADAHSPDCLAVSGATLLALANGRIPQPTQRREAKRLMRAVLRHYLGPRPLASRELFRSRYIANSAAGTTNDNEE